MDGEPARSCQVGGREHRSEHKAGAHLICGVFNAMQGGARRSSRAHGARAPGAAGGILRLEHGFSGELSPFGERVGRPEGRDGDGARTGPEVRW
jgi:hypothetical protein